MVDPTNDENHLHNQPWDPNFGLAPIRDPDQISTASRSLKGSTHSRRSGHDPDKPSKVDISSADVVEVSSQKSLNPRKSRGESPMGTTPFATGMENRDPNNLNSHCQVMFDDIIGEPEGPRTPDKCWDCSHKCYDCTRNCCYVLLVVLFAPFIAFCNGINFACVTFNQVWCVGPCLRMWKINCATIRKFWWGCLLAVSGPCCEVCGLYFSKIKIRYQKLPDDEDKENIANEYFNI